MDAKDYLLGFGKQLGYDLTLDEWMAALKASISPLPDALALAEQIRRKTRTAVLNNNNLLVRQHSGILFPELRRAFGATFIRFRRVPGAKAGSCGVRSAVGELGHRIAHVGVR